MGADILYPPQDPIQLDRDGNYYCRHVHAMTAEGLHDKSDIAEQLAWRDRELDRRDAEIVRLRGEVGSFLPIGHRCEWQDNIGRWWPCTITGWSPAVYGADLDDGTQANGYARGRFRSSIAPAEAKGPAPAMPNGVEASREQFNAWMKTRGVISSWHVQQDMWNAWTASRAADNRDAAGVGEKPCKGCGNPVFAWADDSDVRCLDCTPAAVPAGEAVASDDARLHAATLRGISSHLRACPPYEKLRGDADCIDAAADFIMRTPQPADGEAVAPHGRIRWLDGDFEIEWLRDWAGGDCDVYLGTTPPAPVQAAPQEGEDAAIAAAFREVGACSYAQDSVAGELFAAVRKRAALQHRGDSQEAGRG